MVKKELDFLDFDNYRRHFASFYQEQVLYISCEICVYTTKRFHDFKSHLRCSYNEIREHEKYHSGHNPETLMVVPRIPSLVQEIAANWPKNTEETEKQYETENKISKVNITVISERGSSNRKLVFDTERQLKIMKQIGGNT